MSETATTVNWQQAMISLEAHLGQWGQSGNHFEVSIYKESKTIHVKVFTDIVAEHILSGILKVAERNGYYFQAVGYEKNEHGELNVLFVFSTKE